MTTRSFSFAPVQLPASAMRLRAEVREFLAGETAAGTFAPGPAGWARIDPAFSQRLGARGWLGMTWPKKYGGHERSALERYVVIEELLVAGAPMRGHWAADRQLGPLLLEFGTEEQRQRYLPEIAAGRCLVAIGLSEPDSGSDLSAIRTSAVKVDGGWKVNGTKIWTSLAHRAQLTSLFVRTSPKSENRHAGVSRFLVDMACKGITVRPVINMLGEHDFIEVVFEDLFVPDNMVVGEVGAAWQQMGKDLAYERSAPDRWLASHDLLLRTIERIGDAPNQVQRETIGRLVAHLWTLQNMSLSIAGMLGNGQNPSVEASIVKDLGTQYDQEVPQRARALVPEHLRVRPDAGGFEASLRHNLQFSPAVTIRGGTTEILRNTIARALGLR